MASQEITLSQELVAAPKTGNLSDLQRLGNILVASGYFADARDMAQAAVKVMAGQELGLPPIVSMMGIHIIKGKVALGVHLIASRVKAHGFDFRITKQESDGCVIQFFSRPDSTGKRQLLGESSFTEADAKAAQVFGDMYKKFPRNMYYSRAMSNGAKWYTPEIFGGAPVYTPEELGAAVDDQGEIVHAEPEGIDTGGHPVGTQAAADHVANDKIREMQSRSTQAAAVPPEITALWKRITSTAETCKVFAELKQQLADDSAYYAILAKHGVTHANEFKSTAPARKAARELYEAIQRIAPSSTEEMLQASVEHTKGKKQSKYIGSSQIATLMNRAKDIGWQALEVRKMLQQAGIDNEAAIPVERFDEVMRALEPEPPDDSREDWVPEEIGGRK